MRFRHTDSDIVRDARQQDFIRWAKEQYPISNLVAHRDRLLHIFGRHSTLDKALQTEDGILELFNLVLNADGSTIKQVPFPADLQPCTATSCFVTAEQSREAQVFTALHGGHAEGEDEGQDGATGRIPQGTQAPAASTQRG